MRLWNARRGHRGEDDAGFRPGGEARGVGEKGRRNEGRVNGGSVKARPEASGMAEQRGSQSVAGWRGWRRQKGIAEVSPVDLFDGAGEAVAPVWQGGSTRATGAAAGQQYMHFDETVRRGLPCRSAADLRDVSSAEEHRPVDCIRFRSTDARVPGPGCRRVVLQATTLPGRARGSGSRVDEQVRCRVEGRSLA